MTYGLGEYVYALSVLLSFALLMMCPLQRSEGRQAAEQETMKAASLAQLRESRYKTKEFLAWLQDKDAHDAEQLIRISNLPINHAKESIQFDEKENRRSLLYSSHHDDVRDVSQIFSETTTRGMFQQIFELMLKEN